ncbi:hypothetical protein ES703_79898 [subsurface metagenome]
MAGSIAGNTFARNRSGNYIRAKTKPINPNSSSAMLLRDVGDGGQSIVRAALAKLSVRWSQAIGAAARTAWNLYGASVAMKNKLGETIFLSGYNHFIRSNMFLCIRNETLVDSGPTIFELPEKDPTIVIEPMVHENRAILTFDDTMVWVDEDEAFLIIREGQPQNPQRNFFGGPYRGFKDKGGDSASPKTSPETFTNLHLLTAGQKVWYELRIIRADGRLSEPWYVSNIVVAGPL